MADELRRRFDKLIALGIVEPPGPTADEPVPGRLGHYRLLRRLGGGGMGVVYEARDEKLNRRVALKVIRGEQRFFAGSRERFAREMQAASRLDHPHLCPIYEAGEIEGVPYLAMRYVEGQSLAQLLDDRRRERGAVSTSSRSSSGRARLDAVLLIEKVARALHAAHEAGIVHRDVKPANVLIDGDGEPVLVDFGLARDSDASLVGLTHTGERLGTPAYMAPEQVTGRGTVDRRTDVYGLGATLYECLTLQCPFESTAREDLYHRILTEPPRDPRALDRGIGGELSVVLGKALEKDPKDRFATAEELAEELRRIRAHEPIQSRRPSVLLRAVRWTQRNRAAAGILAATLVGLALSLWFLRLSTLSETRFRALAWLQGAGAVEDENPQLAFKYAREALRMHDDPVIVARIQEVMFRMRQHVVLTRRPATGSRLRFSPDGRYLAVLGYRADPVLLRREGDAWQELPLPGATWYTEERSNQPAFSSDSGQLALLTADGVRRYDLRGDVPRVLGVLEHDDGGSWSLCYSPNSTDDRLLIAATGSARLWKGTGEVTKLPGESPFRSVLSRDGRTPEWHTASFLRDDLVAAVGSLWTVDGEWLAHLDAPSTVVAIVVGEDRFMLVTELGDIRAFDFDGHLIGYEQGISLQESHVRWVSGAEIDPSGSWLLLSFTDGRVQLRDAITLDLEREWFGGTLASFSPKRPLIASGGTGGVQIHTLKGELLDVLGGQGGKVGTVQWSPDGEELVSVARGSGVRLWSLEAWRGVPAYLGLGTPDIAVSPSGEAVAIASDADDALRLCDARGELLRRQSEQLLPSHVRFARDGSIMVAAHWGREFLQWDPLGAPPGAGHTQVLRAPFMLGSNSAPDILADGRWLLNEGNGRLHTWRPGDGRGQLFSALGTFDGVITNHFAVSDDGTRVLASGWYGLLLLGIDGEVLWRAPERSNLYAFPTFSRDGSHVLAAADDNNAYLWKLDAPEPTVFPGHQSALSCAVFSMDETRIATASKDGSIRIWDRASAQTILRLRHEGVRRIAFTSSGQLVSAGTDGSVRWWWLEVEPLRRAVEQLDVGELTDADRDRVGHLLDD